MGILYNKGTRKFQEGGSVPSKEALVSAGDPNDAYASDIPVDVEDVDSEVVKAKVALDRAKRRERVTRLQKIMIQNGLLNGEGEEAADGVIGLRTKGAIEKAKRIQKMLKVKQDGIIGKKTIRSAAEKGVGIDELVRHIDNTPMFQGGGEIGYYSPDDYWKKHFDEGKRFNEYNKLVVESDDLRLLDDDGASKDYGYVSNGMNYIGRDPSFDGNEIRGYEDTPADYDARMAPPEKYKFGVLGGSDFTTTKTPEEKKIIEDEIRASEAENRTTRIQQILIDYGALSGEGAEGADGKMGANTSRAMDDVEALQDAIGADKDGIIGPETIRKAKEKGIDIRQFLSNRRAPKTGGVGSLITPDMFGKIDEVAAMKVIDDARELKKRGFNKGGVLYGR